MSSTLCPGSREAVRGQLSEAPLPTEVRDGAGLGLSMGRTWQRSAGCVRTSYLKPRF